MENKSVLPIEFGGWDPVDELVHVYYDVTFTEDFGVFIKGEKLSCINVDYNKGIVEGLNDSGEKVIKTQFWSATPIN